MVKERATETGCLYSTNHFLEAGRGSALHDPVRLPSLFRYQRLKWFARGKRHRLDVADVKKSLTLVSSRWLNLQSMVFEPRRRRMEVSMGSRPASKGPYVAMDGEMLALAVALSLLAGFLSGVYPAWRACRIAPAIQLKLQ